MNRPLIMVIYRGEDDPSKNTALKMIRLGLAVRIDPRRIHGSPVILDPYAQETLGPWSRGLVTRHGLMVFDASWKKLSPARFHGIRGRHQRLPPLLAGNPVNYARPCMLSSIEAVAGALYITGFQKTYTELLGLYKWMETFHTLNKDLLEEYSKAQTPRELEEIVQGFWGSVPPC